MNYQKIFLRIISCLRAMISSESFLEQHRIAPYFSRHRKLSMRQLVFYLLYSSKAAMPSNISNIRKDLVEIDFPSISKQAVSKARKGISSLLFKNLFLQTVKSYYQMIEQRQLWNGYHVFAVDGFKLQLPNSKSNIETFGSRFNTANPNEVFSIALGSALYDVLEDIIIDSSINHDLTSERFAAEEHLLSAEPLDILSQSIIIYDRGYYSAKIFSDFCARNYLCLMRVKESLKITRSDQDDSVQQIDDPNHPGKQLAIRVLKVPLSESTTEYLVTNVFDPSITAAMFKELYFLRWKIESKYNELKNQWELEEFSGATALSVTQEFYINMMYANLASIVKSQADSVINKKCRKTNDLKYQSTRSFIINQIKREVPRSLCGHFDTFSITKLFLEASDNKTPIQPDRSFKRKKKKDDIRNHFTQRKSCF